MKTVKAVKAVKAIKVVKTVKTLKAVKNVKAAKAVKATQAVKVVKAKIAKTTKIAPKKSTAVDPKLIYFVGSKDSFDTEEMPRSWDDVPAEVKQAYEINQRQIKKPGFRCSVKNSKEIIELLSPFLRGLYLIDNFDPKRKVFSAKEPETVDALRCRIDYIQYYGKNILPQVSASALFLLRVKKRYFELEKKSWGNLELGDELASYGLTFTWDFPKFQDGCDGSCGSTSFSSITESDAKKF
jgi:hypothetical protein